MNEVLENITKCTRWKHVEVVLRGLLGVLHENAGVLVGCEVLVDLAEYVREGLELG